jgi:hypothetical protein
MRNGIPIGLLAATLGAAACVPRASIYAENSGELHDVRVLAADRLVIDGQSLTLADAQAPRPAPDAACRAEAVAARQAVEAARSALAAARHVDVRRTEAAGDLRLVNVDGFDLGQTLISQGLAVDRTDAPVDWCLRADNQARLGLATADPRG